MKEYLFSEKELELIEYLKSNSPKKIWFEHIQYIFEYDNFYLKLEIECAEKLRLGYIPEKKFIERPTSDLEQYVMVTKLEKINLKFQSQTGSELLSSNENITEVNIVRTLLFYCQHVQSKEHSNFFNTDSHQINPNLEIDKKLKIEQTCLADVGLWIRLDKKVLNCFIIDNDDDFSTNSHCYENVDLKRTKKDIYSFIETE
ncbi:hypothetical protein M8845_18615 [Gelidibacter japonicus]|uniref:hypothetical protein n=1 Tax=Gelidibacter TaxID=49279 RepID=UPI001FF20A25|nr:MULTISPECIES: hypothetical protein [Gelidibacter]MCK0114664.1 hypothetical protein [Gelidibacter sp. F63206]MCL8009440.1 hypothetical protein [Gelidibacter japonicus]